MSLLLLLAALLALLLLSKMLANFLVPFPLALDVSGSVFHVHLFLAFALEFVKAVFLLTVTLGLLVNFTLDLLRNLFDGVFLASLALVDFFSIASDVVDFDILQLILIISLLSEDVSLLLKELSDPVADKVFGLDLLFEKLYPLVKLELFLVKDATLAAQLAFSLSSSVLNVKLLFGLGLIDLLFEVEDLLIVLISFFSELVLGLLKVLVQALDLLIKVLLLVAKSVELPLSIKSSLDICFELGIA